MSQIFPCVGREKSQYYRDFDEDELSDLYGVIPVDIKHRDINMFIILSYKFERDKLIYKSLIFFLQLMIFDKCVYVSLRF